MNRNKVTYITSVLSLAVVCHAFAEPNPVAKDLQRIVGELEEMENNLSSESLRPQTTQSTAKSESAKRNEADGLVIVSETEASRATRELAEKLTKIQRKNNEMRAKVLALQDELASRMHDKANVEIELVGSEETKSNFRVLELEAKLNEVNLVRYSLPSQLTKSQSLPLYVGPLPVGKYDLSVHLVVGNLTQGWPYGVAQGKWRVEKKLSFLVDEKYSGKTKLALKKLETGEPELELVQNNENKK